MIKKKAVSELAKWVTFQPNRKRAIYNWFYFKEGFSKELVDFCIDNYNMSGPILDPFCGSGTTLLACKERGIESAGLDISPLAVFVSKVKTRDYDTEALWKIWAELKEEKVFEKELPKDPWIRSIFYKDILHILLGLKNSIMELEERERDFFLLALMNAAYKVALFERDGAVLKRVKKPKMPIKKIFLNLAKRMIKDLEKHPIHGPIPKVIRGDARRMPIQDGFEGIITSPPYLNKIEYTKVYRMELSLFLGLPETELRSYIGKNVWEIDEKYAGLPSIAVAYFKDMERVLKECHRVMGKGIAVFVIAGGCFPDKVVQADEILGQIAQEIGFKLIEILPAREIWCTRQRTVKVGKVRESLVVLEK